MITVDLNKIHNDNNIALGNHLFQYVICRLVAEKNNYNFFIPYSGYLKDFFPNLELGVKDGEIINTFFEDTGHQQFNPEIFNLPNFTNLSGYFQTEKYFENYEYNVFEWFNMGDLPKLDENLCLIHLRGGDNRTGPIAIQLGWLLPKEYYEKAMAKIIEYNKDVIFKVITDDVELSKIYFPNLEIMSKNTIEDFKLLRSCKYSIISPSTFSWWARWLSNGITIAPNNWLNYNNPAKGFYPVDIKSKKFKYVD